MRREGIRGADAMNIDGKNGLACLTHMRTLPRASVLRRLQGLPVVRGCCRRTAPLPIRVISRRPVRQPGGSIPAAPLPGDHELYGRMPEGAESDPGDFGDPDDAGQADGVTRDV